MRPLSAEERALWRKVVESVRPLHHAAAIEETPVAAAAGKRPAPPAPVPARKAVPGTTLDGTWDRRLARGLVQPERVLDLHGHSLATAYGLLDHRLEQAVATGDRVLLLITGKPRAGGHERRGAIRAAVGDWLAASRHAADIAAVRGAHPRHGGAGALYIVLRRKR
ncbi:MAG TPA: Smr/MutS family protein [Allosphingosinicella sp.]|nr:Smr/MutS family protein [Allosphingosinicella sp.]